MVIKAIYHKYQMLLYYLTFINPLIGKKVKICKAYGPKVNEHYNFLAKSQFWSSQELRQYQTDKLKKLITYVYENVPYYRDLMEERKLGPKDFACLEDIQKLPILNKNIIRSDAKSMLSQNFSDKLAVVARTGASTGEPLVFYIDKNATDVAWASWFRFSGWMGYEWGDRIAHFWRTPKILQQQGNWYQNILDLFRYSHVMNIKHFDAFKMSEEYFADYVREMEKYKPAIIRGYTSAVMYFTDYCIKNKITKLKPKAITTTAEPILARERRVLEDYYGCKVFDQYGCGEIYSVSFECEKHSGLHITSEHCIVEVVDEYGESVENGKEGRIIITDLDNYMMPFIRYENGDVGSLKTDICSCGRNLPLMDHVKGRIFGLIRGVNGNVVHGEFFANLLEKLGWYESFDLMHFEVVQKTIDGFDCNFVCKKKPSPEAIDDFISSCYEFFGEMKININFVDNIPVTSAGKRRNTRSAIDPIHINIG